MIEDLKSMIDELSHKIAADIQGWRLPWGHTFQPNIHMILPLCNRGSQRIW